MVKCTFKNNKIVKSTTTPEIVVFDPDGNEIHRGSGATTSAINQILKEAKKKANGYVVNWDSFRNLEDGAAKAKTDGKIVALTFLDDKKKSEAFIESCKSAWVGKQLKNVVFVKYTYEKKAEIVKKWKVFSAPTMILIDPKEEDEKKATLNRLSAKTSTSSIRSAVKKALKKYNDRHK